MNVRQEHSSNLNPADQTAVKNVQVGGNFTIETITQNISQIVIKETGDRPPKIIKIDWRRVCSQVLIQQQKNQRLRRKATELGFELNVYVPLGLVKRKQQQRRSASDDVEQEEVYLLSDKEIIKTYEHDAFLNEVIDVSSTGNNHVAIVGEPGSGKTTLLARIADWIDKKQKGLPIYISLASLQEQSLEKYLLEVWLEEVLNCIVPEARIYSDAVRESLKESFRVGVVWLLLDGLDEMAVGSSTSALAKIQSQLLGWIAQANVVLTSRLNVWDVRLNNPLANFETYRTLEFSQEQVKQFIEEWFAAANNELLGTQFQTELEESKYKRVRELVKNPLRLALLCQTWYHNQGELPETKAGLYRRFVRDFYREWKSELHPLTRSQQKKLNQALGKLALAGIDSEIRFRLPEELADEVMREKLFESACALGWLNLVDRDAQTGEGVYAFFHPTFQEYFAATAIVSDEFFLKHSLPATPSSVNEGVYRVFEKKWQEVYLLWLGRADIDKEKKEKLIKALVDFKDGCGDPKNDREKGYESFYTIQAYSLATIAISEFRDCSQAEQIIDTVVKWSFGYVDISTQQWMKYIKPFADEALPIVFEMETMKIVSALERLIKNAPKGTILRQKAVEILQKIDPVNDNAYESLVSRLNRSFTIKVNIPTPLQKFTNGIAEFPSLRNPYNIFSTKESQKELQKISLENICLYCNNKHLRKQAAIFLSNMDPTNQIAKQTLLDKKI